MSASISNKKIGVSTNVCTYSTGLYEAVDELSRHFNIIEIELENMIRQCFETNKIAFEEEIKRVLRLKSKKNLQFCMHASYLGSDTDLTTNDPQLRQEVLWRMMECLELATDLGCRSVTYFPLSGYHKPEKQALSNLQRTLAKLAFYAEKLSVMIMLEYIPAQITDKTDIGLHDMIWLCKEFNLKLALNLSYYKPCYDTAEWCSGFLGQILPYLGKVYVANKSARTYHVNIEHYHQTLSFLYQHAFNGAIIIERKHYLSGMTAEDKPLLMPNAGLKNNILNTHEFSVF